jgi:hypothetical protein
VLKLLLGIALSALPRRWRARFALEQTIPWERAAVVSGLLQSFAALVALVVWYSHSVTHWAANALDSALRNGPEAQVPGQAIGFSALVLWCLHPLTWLFAYFAAEGLVRFLAALATEQILPSWPLVIADWSYGKVTGRPPEGDALHYPSGREQLGAIVIAARQAAKTVGLSELPDQLVAFTEGGDAILEIRASHPKSEWTAPRVVRIANHYYRLESASQGPRPRPFIFRLRRLAAGVPGRKVLLYDPPPPPVPGSST